MAPCWAGVRCVDWRIFSLPAESKRNNARPTERNRPTVTAKFLKRATKSPVTGEADTRSVVQRMLAECETGGEARVREYARELDGWEKDIVVSRDDINAAASALPAQMRADIKFSHARVKTFAEAQLDSLGEFETELSPGLFAGQRLVAVNTAGCYVPGGRYAHIASAIMSITTASVAGVRHIVACSPAHKERGVHPAILYAADLAGADTILALGGVQGIAAMAFGHFTGHAADILVGPGNRFVAEAKRVLFGRVGIDLFAGPTEILIIADHTADAVLAAVPGIIARLPQPNRATAEAAWREYGEVVVASSAAEAVRVSDDYAPEHLEVHGENLDWWLQRLSNYGSLFLGEQTTVAYGDKCSGPNHILPTKGAARYTGGLSVGKFIKVLTWQRMTEEANREVGAVTARISRAEGMHGHALTGDDRLGKYFPGERFDLGD